MPRLDRLPQINRSTILNLPVQVNDTAPFTPLPRPLGACPVALVYTAGVDRGGERANGPGDTS